MQSLPVSLRGFVGELLCVAWVLGEKDSEKTKFSATFPQSRKTKTNSFFNVNYCSDSRKLVNQSIQGS